MRSYLCLLMLLPVVAACVQIKDKSKGDDAPVVQDHYVETTSVPNEFRVHLSSLPQASEIRRQDLSKQEVSASAVDLNQTVSGFVDSHVLPGEQYRYQYLDGSGELLRSVDITIPQDLVIDHEVVLSQSPQWQDIYRVYFKNAGVLTTNGFNVLLKTQMLYSEHGTIRSFVNGVVAPSGKSGRSGGEIKIFVDHAQGDLSIEMRGESGGPGVAVSQDGGDGGNSGDFLFDSETNNNLKIVKVIQAGTKGLGNPGVPEHSIFIMGQAMTIAAQPAGTAGRDGQRQAICFSQQGRMLNCEQ